MSDDIRPMTPEEAKARKSRNLVLAACLVGFAVLIVGITIVRLQDGVVRKQDWQAATSRSGDGVAQSGTIETEEPAGETQ